MTRNELLLKQKETELVKIENRLAEAWDEYMVSGLNQVEVKKWQDARDNCKAAIEFYKEEILNDLPF